MGRRRGRADFMGGDEDSGGEGDEAEILRKAPADNTERMIQDILKADVARKKAKSGGLEGPEKSRAEKASKGKTLAEIEEEEGGPVKESLVGMAQVKRAQGRKAGGPAAPQGLSTDVGEDVEAAEEAAQVQEEDGVQFTGFNLKEERETGYFDDEGNYVESKVKDGTERDAWMNSEEAKVVSEEVRRKIAERERQAAEAEARRAAGPMTDRQIAALKSELASHMQPGETLAKALKRIGGSSNATAGAKALGKRDKARLAQQQQQQQVEDTGDRKQQEVFTRMTEIADQLVDEGEMDVYDAKREDFERFAAMWMPRNTAPQAAAAAGPANGGGAKLQAGAKADDEDDDMFAEDDDKGSKSAPAAPAAQGGQAEAAAAPAGVQAAAKAEEGADGPPGPGEAAVAEYSSWPVKELKRFLQERGVDPSSFVEKSDMARKVAELAAAGPVTAGAAGQQGGGGTHPAPPGFVFHPHSGYFYNSEHGMYFDTSSGGFFKGSSWFTYEPGSGRYLPYTG